MIPTDTRARPGEMTGRVQVTSRFQPSVELGGDSYNYTWIDDDHLAVHMIDVAGHGMDSALLSVSVLNTLRCPTLPIETLLDPEQVLTTLNGLFPMQQHDGMYFAMWYGVYQASTRQLRYASAGHPPALGLAVNHDRIAATLLSTGGKPVGLLDNTAFTAGTYQVPDGAQILLYSDGAFDLTTLGGGVWSQQGFVELCIDLAAESGLSLDELVHHLQDLSRDGRLEDDCSLILLRFT